MEEKLTQNEIKIICIEMVRGLNHIQMDSTEDKKFFQEVDKYLIYLRGIIEKPLETSII